MRITKWYILILILLFIFSRLTLIENDDKQYIGAGKLKPTDTYGAGQFQDVIGKWIEIKETATADTANDKITFSNANFDASEQFTIGDRVRLRQTGWFPLYIYFYVKEVSTSYIKVAQSLNNFLVDGAVTDMALSGIPANGFPTLFEYEISASGSGSMDVTINPPNATCVFHLIGDLVVVEVVVFGMVLATSADTDIYINLPITYTGSGLAINSTGFGTDGDGSEISFNANLDAVNNRVILTKKGGGNWALGSGGTLQFKVQYQI